MVEQNKLHKALEEDATLENEILFNEDFEEMFAQYVESEEKEEGTTVEGTIVALDRDSVYVDVGLKSEGRVPKREFEHDPEELLQVGNKVLVFLERYEARGGRILVSRERAIREAAWSKLKVVYDKDETIEGNIMGRVKGGFAVDLGGVIAFLPGSQVDVRPIKDITPLVGIAQPFKILKMDEGQGNIVVSRKAIMEESRAGERDKVLSEIKEGSTLEAVVKNITDYGAFMDCGVFDGLLHITDISWGKISHPSEILSIGQTLKVVVTKFNPETKRVSLGLKQLEKNPWEGLIDKYKAGEKFPGKITSVADYGAFVELEPGVEGLVYQTEIAYNMRNLNPRKLLKIGDEVEVMVLDVDLGKQRIGLSIKKCLENPWKKFAETHPSGSKVKCTVKNIADFGVFAEIETGEDIQIEGMIPAMELTWSQNYDRELKKYKPGDTLDAVVAVIDLDRERVSLSVRRNEEDYVSKLAEELKSKESVMCTVIAVKKEGIEVSIEGHDSITTFIRKSELSKHRSEQYPARFAVEEKVEAKFMSFDQGTRRFNVSIRALEVEQEKEVIAKYGSTDSGASLGEILGDSLPEQLRGSVKGKKSTDSKVEKKADGAES